MIRLLFALSLALSGVAAAAADPLKDTMPSVSVVGEAHEDVAPDRATLRFGVVSEQPTAVEAAAENARAVAAVMAELKAQGVADSDMRTEGLTLAPFSVEERDAKGKPTGAKKLYRARNELSVRIKEIGKAGDIAGRLFDKGVNSFQGVDYEYSDPAEKLDALRAAAAKDAERRARSYAEALGLHLSRVLEIRPADDAVAPHPMMARMAAAPADAGSMPLRPGLQRISARVAVTWALSR